MIIVYVNSHVMYLTICVELVEDHFGVSFDVSRSTFDEDEREKSFWHFRSHWPWPWPFELELEFTITPPNDGLALA